jgi:hypothetical protein
MKKWWVVIVVAVVLVGLIAWSISKPSTQTGPTASSTPEIISGVPNATYTNTNLSFSIQYPSTAVPSQDDVSGFLQLTQTPITSFVLPANMSAGTNLAEAGVYIGATTTPAIVSICTIAQQNLGEVAAGSATINGATFSVFTSTDAGAGNLYEGKIYRALQNGACLEIVELLHSGNIDNYTPGTVEAFDHAKFSGILEAIVQTYQSIPTGI